MAGLEREIDRLFTLPPRDFTAARNELARRLKKDGQSEAADEVRSLPKPTVPVWAVNQLARREKPAVRALLKAGDTLRAAQAQALAGEGTSDALRDAQRAEREAVQRLTELARPLLESEGQRASPAQLERIGRTLGAAAVDPGARPLLDAGRLTRELEPGGFETLAGLEVTPPRTGQKGRDELAARRQEKEERRRRKLSLQASAREAERQAREAEREAVQTERAARRAREAADQARADADRAAAELAELER